MKGYCGITKKLFEHDFPYKYIHNRSRIKATKESFNIKKIKIVRHLLLLFEMSCYCYMNCCYFDL